MDFTSVHKAAIEKMIVETIVIGLDNGGLKEEDLSGVADFTLERIDKIKTQEELLGFLAELSAKWPVFKRIEEVEKGEAKEQKEEQVTQDVLQLAKEGKIEDAIQLAKTVTTNT